MPDAPLKYQLLAQQLGGAWSTYSYDPVGNMLVNNSQGSAPMSFSYDAANRIVTMTQGSGRTTYTFDPTGNLTVENLAGSLTSYVYDNANRLQGIQFPDSSRSTYSYDGDGLRRSAFEAGGALTTFIWDGNDYLGQY